MLLDIMSSYNYVPVNTKAIKVFGLQTAAYIAVLSDIYPRVVQKKLNELITNGYFTVNREYVEGRCGLKPEEQLAADLGLERAGVLAINPQDPNQLAISMDALFEILAENDAKVLEKIQKKAKTKVTDAAEGKRKGKISTFCAFTSTLSHVPEVQEAYKLWVESIIEGKKGNLTKGVIQIFHDTITSYTSDPAMQVSIIRNAAASGYTNASWVLPKTGSRSFATSPAAATGVQQKQFTGVGEETF
jgi:hypothetical protein